MTEKCDSFSWINEQLEEKWTSLKLDYISDSPGLNSNKSTIISLILNSVFYLHTLRRLKKVRSKTTLCAYDITERR